MHTFVVTVLSALSPNHLQKGECSMNKTTLIRRFAKGLHLFFMATLLTLLAGPAVAPVGAQGPQDLYVSSVLGGDVRRFDGTTGAFLGVFGQADQPNGGLVGPNGLVFGPDGNLYVASSGTNDVRRFDGTTGAFLGVFGQADKPNGGLNAPYHLVFAAAHTLTVDKAGTGTGTVTSDPAGINCGGDCTEDYIEGTVITLTAHPGVKSYFIEWSGNCYGMERITQITMDADKICTATFGYPVGGIVVPVDRLGLVAPWMGLVGLAGVAALGVMLVRRHKL
jgi:hypothetical protein